MNPLTGALAWRLAAARGEDEAALVARLAGGDEAALVELYERHAGPVLAYLRHLAPDPNDAEELLQDTFVAAWRAARDFAGRSSVRTWLLGIARRRARDRRRRAGVPLAPVEELDQVAVDGGEDATLARLELQQLASLIARLPVSHREVLVLALVHELSMAEVALVLGVPVGTVKTRLRNARRTLRALAAGPSTREGEEERA